MRVAGLKQQIESGASGRGLDGLTPAETLRAVQRRIRRMVLDQYVCWSEELAPGSRHTSAGVAYSNAGNCVRHRWQGAHSVRAAAGMRLRQAYGAQGGLPALPFPVKTGALDRRAYFT